MAKRPQQPPKTNQERRSEDFAPMIVEPGKRRDPQTVAMLTGRAPRCNRFGGRSKRYDRSRERTVRGLTQE